MYWLNIDIPTQKMTIHKSNCLYKPTLIVNKPVNQMGKKGGWYSFPDIVSLKQFWITNKFDYELNYCKICRPP